MAMASSGTSDVVLRGYRNQVYVASGDHTGSYTYVSNEHMGGDYNEIYANVYDGSTSSGRNLTGTFYLKEGCSCSQSYDLKSGNTVALYAGNNTWSVVSVSAEIYYNL